MKNSSIAVSDRLLAVLSSHPGLALRSLRVCALTALCAWSAAAGGTPPAAVASRNAGSNPASLTANAPVLGATWTAMVDLSITGHSLAVVFGFDGPANVALAGGQRLLCLDTFGSGELLKLSPRLGDLVPFEVPVPNLPALAGMTACTQALHFSGIVPFALSNALDLTLGI